ncbi:acyltransferase family protein, partial [Neobacillus drentensis]|uniref:acyltransferase family protein n=1 Tax=Neobacillus drentensis TaxID=220684 RepID=UPI002FFDFA0C
MRSRFEELDSLRGIASMSVFFGHLTLIPKFTVLSILTTVYFPLNMFFSGGASVIFFFVLSGFVLFLPYSNGKHQNYRGFLIKRVFRIYIPYLIAIILTIVACLFLSTGGIKGLSNWFNESWKFPITFNTLVNHIVLIGNFYTNEFDDVIWTLIQEMR